MLLLFLFLYLLTVEIILENVPCPIFGPCLLWPNGWMDQDGIGMEVNLGPGHIVLDGDPAPLPKKVAEPPIFGPFLFWPSGWMHQDATWYRGRPRPRRLCFRWGHSYPQKKRAHHGTPTQFWPMYIVAKRLDG